MQCERTLRAILEHSFLIKNPRTVSRYLGYAHRFLMTLLGFYYLDTSFISIYGWDAWGFSGPDCHYLDVEAELCPVGRY